jgi:hypothetical protein
MWYANNEILIYNVSVISYTNNIRQLDLYARNLPLILWENNDLLIHNSMLVLYADDIFVVQEYNALLVMTTPNPPD